MFGSTNSFVILQYLALTVASINGMDFQLSLSCSNLIFHNCGSRQNGVCAGSEDYHMLIKPSNKILDFNFVVH